MANSILSQFVSQSSFKLYSSTGASVLDGVKIVRVNSRLSGKLLKNMGEDGSEIIDTKIILPLNITVTAYADSNDAVAKINNLLQDINGRYDLYSRGLYFKGLTLANQQISQSPDYLSATPVNIVFKGIIRQGDGSIVTAQAGDATTIIGGIINTANLATDGAISAATAAANKVSELASLLA